MLPTKMKVNNKLLPIKSHFFLFNAGTAPLVPYLPTYARQLGFSSASVGLIYTILPIFGLIAKPLFGVIADRFKLQKSIFIIFQIVIIVSFFSIQLIPESKASVQLDCGDGASFLRSCFTSENQLDKITISAIGNLNRTATCQMNCDMATPKMWQTVCEHWQLPQYCYSNTDNIQYRAHVANVSVDDKCAYVHSDNVTLGEHTYKPSCHIGGGYVDIDLPCRLNCTNQRLAAALANQQANMTCIDNQMSYRVCPNDRKQFIDLKGDPTTSFQDCAASCDLDETAPWHLMEICEGWEADVAAACKPKTKLNQHYPEHLSFTSAILMNTIVSVKNCAFVQLNHIVFEDGSSHYPRCVPKPQYQLESELFRASCKINCDNDLLNLVFRETSQDGSADYTRQFWLFFMLMIISWIGQAVVVTFADAICFNLLGTKVSHYGKQRLWGSLGFGILSLVTGALIDVFSEGAYKNYLVAFVLMFIFMSGDVIVSCFVKNESTKMSVNILADVGSLLSSLPTFIFMLWTIAVGLCTALIWNFLFWHIEVISESYSAEGFAYTKTLQGLVSAIQTFGGEIPFLFVSGYVLRKLGHVNVMSLVLFAFGVRFILYSFVQNPWWILPIELFQGITFGMFYPTMTSYATVVSPPGTETTVQGLVGAVFEGVGTSLGSFIGGFLIDKYGGWLTFRWFGIGALLFCIVHIVVQHLLKDRLQMIGPNQGYSSIIRYEQPNDSVHILEEEDG